MGSRPGLRKAEWRGICSRPYDRRAERCYTGCGRADRPPRLQPSRSAVMSIGRARSVVVVVAVVWRGVCRVIRAKAVVVKSAATSEVTSSKVIVAEARDVTCAKATDVTCAKATDVTSVKATHVATGEAADVGSAKASDVASTEATHVAAATEAAHMTSASTEAAT